MVLDRQVGVDGYLAGRASFASAGAIPTTDEASPGVSTRDVEAVLAGDGSYDALLEREQAIVRATWDERIAERLSSLDLEETFTAANLEWVEADDEGNLVTRRPAGA